MASFRRPAAQGPLKGLYLAGGSVHPGAGGADGGAVGQDRGGLPDGQSGLERPEFDWPVPPGGYCWWYVDATSDCGQFALTVIAFVGSVFSPYYHWVVPQGP